MPRRQWEANTKAMIVLEGLKGTPVAELRTEHQRRQAQDAQWRDPLLAHAPKAFEGHAQRPRAARLARAHARVKTLGGELTLERKPSDEVLGGVGPRRFESCRAMKGGSNASTP
jgi:hypothetical protein